MPKDGLAHFNLRIERELLNKLGYIASSEERSINSELLVMIKRRIEQFENIHGKIENCKK